MLHQKKMPKVATAADASPKQGGSPQGEVPTLDAHGKLISENELREEKV